MHRHTSTLAKNLMELLTTTTTTTLYTWNSVAHAIWSLNRLNDLAITWLMAAKKAAWDNNVYTINLKYCGPHYLPMIDPNKWSRKLVLGLMRSLRLKVRGVHHWSTQVSDLANPWMATKDGMENLEVATTSTQQATKATLINMAYPSWCHTISNLKPQMV